MKIKYFLIFIMFWSFNVTFAQNFNWITPNTPYLKLYVIDDGIYRINKSDFINAGINPNTINPRTVKLFYKGNQQPLYFKGEQDGVFNDSDYIDFYGKKNFGGLTTTYKESGGTNIVDYITDEFYDLYSDTSVYWIGWGGNYGLRFVDYNYSSSISYPNNFYFQKVHFEKDLVYSLGEKRSSSDYRDFNTEKVSGEGWYWKDMSKGNTVADTFSTPSVFPSAQLCSLRIFAYPNSYSSSIFNEHHLIIRVNSNIIDTLKTNDYAKVDTTITFQNSLLSSTSVNQLDITYTNPLGYSGRMYFDLFEVNYPKQFRLENNELSYLTSYSDTVSNKFKVTGYISNNETNVYDVNNGFRITNQTSSSDTLSFTGKRNGKFEVVNKYITRKPFRIKQKQVPDLISTSNGTDYIIIYNKLFEQQAEQMRAHRTSHDNFRSFKAEIEDVYDIFNYGIENPVAVRNFVKFIYDNWQTPQVKYVCLFGRGSLDPKRNVEVNQYYKNLVPIYGNPPSDGYFANMDFGTFIYYQNISVGRLPAYTQQEAQELVNKIIAYDNESLDKWVKEFIFITGGFTRQEQLQFQSQSNGIINNYISPPSISSSVTKIYRNDSSGYVTYNYQDSIKKAINRGSLIVNYMGHAASNVWDNGLEDPNVLSNGNKLPLIFSMTCFTGKNAETNFRSFGEKFMYIPNKGSIGFIGTTGWSFSSTGNTYNDYFYRGFAKDSLRRIGDILKYASVLMKPDSLSSAARHTINCYNLLGDPAVKLLIPVYPEFDIQQQDYALSNPYPFLHEDINLSIFPKNLGTNADSCKIRFKLLKNNQNHQTRDTILYNFGYIDTINHVFRMDSSGNYVMKVTLDPDNWYVHESGTNNEIDIPIPLKNISYVSLKPVDNSIIKTDSVEFVGLNPNVNPSFNNVILILQFDTTHLFNSSLNQTYFKNGFSDVATKFKLRIPVLDSNVVYYWRMNSVINNDSSGWSGVRRFIYNPMMSFGEISTRRFFENRLDNVSNNSDSIITIYKKHAGQYSEFDFYNTSFSTEGIKLSKFTGNLLSRSHGENYWDPTYFLINDIEFHFPGLTFRGLNIGKVRKIDGMLLEVRNFKLATPLSSDSVVSFLGTFDSTNVLMLALSVPGSSGFLSTNAKNVIKSFGSIYVDSVTNVWYRWSFISYQGLPNPIVSEAFNKSWVPTISSLQPEFQSTFGIVQHRIGPAEKWKNFSWDQVLYPSSNIKFDVIGVDKNDQEVTLMSNLTNNNLISLENINPYQYPNIRLITKLFIDTLEGNKSPVFNSLKFNYQAPSELIPDNNSFLLSDSIVQEGDSVNISINYFNVGYSNIIGIVNNWTVSTPGGNVLIKSDTVSNALFIDSSMTSQVKLITSRLRNPQKLIDTINIYFETNLLNEQNEFFTYNNTAITKLIITGDSVKPDMVITYDGVTVINGDFIQSKPEVILKFLDDSKMVINDTSNIKVYLDNDYVPYYINGIKNPEIEILFPDEKFLQATVIYKPELSAGEHFFKYVAHDNTGNYSDTVQYNLIVHPELRIINFYNYPNPMTDQTYFIFDLTGDKVPLNCKIKIFTVTGRIIKIITPFVNIGHNQIFWDGRDDDGDALSNGVYFYKMIIEGESKNETSIQKLVVLK
ncbi:C25 family cysteine peptidase [Bacteroidota bacterium]